MRLATIDLDKLLFTNISGSTLSWVNEIDISNAIVTIYSNAISRQAVLNTLDNMDKALDVDRTVERYKALLKECFENLTPLNLVNEWIPVDKDLPEVGEDVLVTRQLHFWDQDEPEYDVRVLRYAGKNDEGLKFRAHNGDYLSDVTAWMPKPQPYTGSEVEK